MQAQACTASTQPGSLLRGHGAIASMPFTFYATIDSDSVRPYMPADVAYMLPASSWARKNLAAPKLPAHITETAADCGGFVATFKWGDYRYTPAAYVRWLHTFGPSWAATMDYCCENEITSGKRGIVVQRQWRTTEMARHFWREYKRVPWVWVPTVQGWEVEDYRRHARELRRLVDEMADYYDSGSSFRVGIGTLCRRASAEMIRRVAFTVAEELPGVPLHLWGIKLGALRDPIALPPAVRSVDSAAWKGLMFSDRTAYKASGLTQRRYSYTVALPAYRAKVERALSQPKQLTLLSA